MIEQLEGDLIRLLEIKIEMLTKISNSFRRSKELLEEDQMDEFNREMERCKDITSLVDEMDVTLAKLKEQIPDTVQGRYARLQNEIVYISRQIEIAHKACNDTAQQKLLVFGQQIKAIRNSKRGIDGYASQFKKSDAFFIDAKK